MIRATVFLADGFEEVEGLTTVDLLRRAEVRVTMVSIMDDKMVTGAHGIRVEADACFADAEYEEESLLVLPGGMPGTLNLGAHKGLTELLKRFNAEGRKLAAICAAPSVLGQLGILEGKRATSYPGFEGQLIGAETTENRVEVSGNVTTSRGVGTAIPFALALIAQLVSEDRANEIKEEIIYGHRS